ncbi:hypothetical protein SAMN05421688_0938 [Poseidonocella pacifica]|uniref:Phosphatidate cytidylyltransferase n=1 Tax=Poseidonocella pacifica TaxID=871651 RepID=A0A1I0VTR1_9RHOB|nr:UDP-2,3-diacylglucosamine diphosphatase LpxI [Poseidonocella pacifica]SFA79343.1 hypothetical protein SAMN05421688_0938 [Poseidonocella pacifica]
MRALIAGRGRLPELVAETGPMLVCALEGQGPDRLIPDLTFRLETIGSFIAALTARGVTEICLAGGIDRPVFDPAALDAATRPLVPILAEAVQAGDDGALRAIMTLFESHGIEVCAAHDLAPGLVAQVGVLVGAPDDSVRSDAERGFTVIDALGPLDVGQACVAGGGQILGIEAVGGTAWLMQSLPQTPLRTMAVLCKGAKPGQDRRADLPAIGPDTAAQAAAAGLRGIVVRAGDVMILDRAATIAACEAAGLLLWVRP